MIESALVFGIIIFLGIAVVLWKLPMRVRLWLLGHDVMLDVTVAALTLWIHWGTMTGLMAATVAGLICACCTKAARHLWGYRDGWGRYVRGSLS